MRTKMHARTRGSLIAYPKTKTRFPAVATLTHHQTFHPSVNQSCARRRESSNHSRWREEQHSQRELTIICLCLEIRHTIRKLWRSLLRRTGIRPCLLSRRWVSPYRQTANFQQFGQSMLLNTALAFLLQSWSLFVYADIIVNFSGNWAVPLRETTTGAVNFPRTSQETARVYLQEFPHLWRQVANPDRFLHHSHKTL